ncbi:hypothetical protein CKO50_18030 [Pseudoalteromonas sp. HM-SA03]|uniref:hypothetical protein n=1 Tax=Pseudoalteromonas sp. HM-SA03 TaxID=2029678 RepID=UPI000BAE1E56|nr:hypothetical protein [Pseudoalteromonas sp. HM-SA03]PAX99952.1 hypothetical protein CKO50_18030 [Pseudoalteromonas sp. HM-SA03]
MELNRICFKDNPWPEGHPIEEFIWSAKVVDDHVWFDLHLKSADYYAEREIEDDDDSFKYPSDWKAPIVWYNYHCCTLSSNYWHDGGFRICRVEKYTPDILDGLEVLIDPNPDASSDIEDCAFHIYLLGHDAVGKHRIRFDRIGDSMQFKITWLGAIALVYSGDYDFRHEFAAILAEVEFPKLA